MKQYTRICASIDLDAVEYNIERMYSNICGNVQMLAVIKTDGYGHGAVQIARMLEEKKYIWGYAAATLDEAVYLKKKGIKKPVLVLGCIFPEQLRDAVENDIRITVYRKETAQELSVLAGELGKKAYIHIKLDTGMARLGFPVQKESVEIIREICTMPGIESEGLYTHFAKADESNKDFTKGQIEKYLYIKQELQKREIEFTYCHCSNSAGIIDMQEANMDLVRAGISIYGLYPSEEVKKENVPLKPVMKLVSHVAHVKWVKSGTPVSYGGTYVTQKDTKIVTVPAGYGDGYPRSLSNKGYVLIHGKKAPIIGRVCMDQFMVDASDIENVKFGDKVTLIGKDGDEELPVEVLGELSGRFNYEFVCDIGKRIPREYIRHGAVTEQVDYFD